MGLSNRRLLARVVVACRCGESGIMYFLWSTIIPGTDNGIQQEERNHYQTPVVFVVGMHKEDAVDCPNGNNFMPRVL